MKRLLIFCSMITVLLILGGCSRPSDDVMPDLVGAEYGDVFRLATDHDLDIIVNSTFSDTVAPNTIVSQSISPGTALEDGMELVITYSRGRDPNGAVVVPDFTGLTQSDIATWLDAEDISNRRFYKIFDDDAAEGVYVYHQIIMPDDRTDPLRRDEFVFYVSAGPLAVQPVAFDNPDTIRGVNLGGWFVLEGWMTPDLFAGVIGGDETAFMMQQDDAVTTIENHWDTFITEADFAWLAEHRVTHVRIPIPWWLFGETFSYTHDGELQQVTYASSLPYLERAMDWAATHSLQVLLDLHTAPGSQNGFDNGGITGVLQWPQGDNIATTVAIIDRIAEQFADHPALWGIEVLNEPGWSVDLNLIQSYYRDAYAAIRRHDADVWIGFHDGFRGYLYDQWRSFFDTGDFHNVFFDVHLYQTFGDQWATYDIHDHIAHVLDEQAANIVRYEDIVPVIVGEWSLGLQMNVYEGFDSTSQDRIRIAYANAQLQVYENAFGWFFWSYRIDRSAYREWDFKRLVEDGILPGDYQHGRS